VDLALALVPLPVPPILTLIRALTRALVRNLVRTLALPTLDPLVRVLLVPALPTPTLVRVLAPVLTQRHLGPRAPAPLAVVHPAQATQVPRQQQSEQASVTAPAPVPARPIPPLLAAAVVTARTLLLLNHQKSRTRAPVYQSGEWHTIN
jgi:hypothetical protein